MKPSSTNHQLVSALRRGVLGITFILCCGIIGYRFIEKWSWSDCFYMTINTVSTVGSSNLIPSPTGRIFTGLLILFGVGLMAYILTRMTEILFQRSLSNVLGRRTMIKKIKHIKNHCIICGYGRTGSHIAEKLEAAQSPYVIIENNEETIKRLEQLGRPYIFGDATEEDILELAGINHADSLIAALDSDPENLYLTITALSLRESLRIIARIHEPASSRKFIKAGATRVVSPISSGANQIAQLILRPSVVDLVELLVTDKKKIAMQIIEHYIEENSSLCQKSIAEAHIRQVLGGMIIAIKHKDNGVTFDPGPDYLLKKGDTLITIRQSEN